MDRVHLYSGTITYIFQSIILEEESPNLFETIMKRIFLMLLLLVSALAVPSSANMEDHVGHARILLSRRHKDSGSRALKKRTTTKKKKKDDSSSTSSTDPTCRLVTGNGTITVDMNSMQELCPCCINGYCDHNEACEVGLIIGLAIAGVIVLCAIICCYCAWQSMSKKDTNSQRKEAQMQFQKPSASPVYAQSPGGVSNVQMNQVPVAYGQVQQPYGVPMGQNAGPTTMQQMNQSYQVGMQPTVTVMGTQGAAVNVVSQPITAQSSSTVPKI